jgi:hypothetical protein
MSNLRRNGSIIGDFFVDFNSSDHIMHGIVLCDVIFVPTETLLVAVCGSHFF